jgi:hypothetical protein
MGRSVRAFLPLSLLACGLSLGGCGAAAEAGPDSTEEGSPDASADAISEAAVSECTAEPRVDGESITEARARCLSRYAERRLATTRGSQPSLSAYTVTVDGGSCFTETPTNGPWIGNFDLRTTSDVRELVQQVEATVEFLVRFDRDADGASNRYFARISHCPSKTVGGPLVLEGSTLFVGMDARWTRFRVQNAFELRDAWSKGDHLKKNFGTYARAWPILDPVGTPRIVLRRSLGDAARAIAQKLQGAGARAATDVRADLLELVRDHVLGDFRGGDATPLADRARAKIESLDEGGLRAFAQRWAEFVSRRESIDGMADAVAAAHEATAKKAYNIDVVQAGLVAVGNFHDIQVSVSGFLSQNAASFARYVTIEKVDHTVRVRQYALVAVYTIDNVDVNVAIGAARGLETAGLEHALARIP